MDKIEKLKKKDKIKKWTKLKYKMDKVAKKKFTNPDWRGFAWFLPDLAPLLPVIRESF